MDRRAAPGPELDVVEMHDGLTAVTDRAETDQHVDRLLDECRRRAGTAAVIVVGLHRLARINHAFGPHVGDTVLRAVVGRLGGTLLPGALLARLAGDRIGIVLPGIDPKAAEEAASVILDRLAARVTVGGREVGVGATAGLALFPDDGHDAMTLFWHAEAAMHCALVEDSRRYRRFDPGMMARVWEWFDLEPELRRAVDAGELVLHYQPRVHAPSGRVAGVEALLRWQHPDLGLLMPMRFLPLAEENGVIVDIDRWVVREACLQLRRWEDAGLRVPSVAVNVSARSLHEADLVSTVRDALASSRLAADRLEIEVTETAVMTDLIGAADVLDEMHALGVRLAVDDFGTGYSSLGYLKWFRFDTLKIDRTFVRNLTGPPTERPAAADRAIVRAILRMAAELGLDVVAEGVETEEQRAVLIDLGCTELQGYFYSRPVAAPDIISLADHHGVCV